MGGLTVNSSAWLSSALSLSSSGDGGTRYGRFFTLHRPGFAISIRVNPCCVLTAELRVAAVVVRRTAFVVLVLVLSAEAGGR